MRPVKDHLQITGHLVELPLPGRARPLDAFWAHGPRRAPTLLLFVHGMGGNFYRSRFKKEVMQQAPARGIDVLSFNNRGYERDVASEDFRDCLADLDAAVAFGAARGYRRFVLLGHSTGCQKITWWQYRRRDPRVAALVLAGIGDDYAIVRRDLGRAYERRMAQARRWVARGWTSRKLPASCLGFTAPRFLSVADPRQLEARLFNFEGPLTEFRSLRTPILALLPAQEEFACLPVPAMAERLRRRTRSRRFHAAIVPDADHSFHGAEAAATRVLLDWLQPGRRRA